MDQMPECVLLIFYSNKAIFQRSAAVYYCHVRTSLTVTATYTTKRNMKNTKTNPNVTFRGGQDLRH